MSTSDYAAMGQPYTAEEIEKMEGADVNRLAGGGGDECDSGSCSSQPVFLAVVGLIITRQMTSWTSLNT